MVEVRPARADEFARVGELTLAAYHAIGIGSPEYDSQLADAERRAREAELLVAVVDGAVAGTITLVGRGSAWREVARPDEDELRMLAVDPAFQARGVGETLVRACQLSRNLVASSAPGMAAAHRLYARLGFRRNPARDWSPRPGLPLIVFEWRSQPVGRGASGPRHAARIGSDDG